MRNFSKSCCLIIVSLGLVASCDLGDKETDTLEVTHDPAAQHKSEALVGPDWLSRNINTPEVKLIELGRTQDEFLQGHIPSARFVDWRNDISDPSKPDRYNLPPKNHYELLLSNLGITSDSTVVLYDTLNNRASARMFWILKYYNHSKIRVLDGGLKAWERSGYSLTDQTPEITPSGYNVRSVNPELLVDLGYVSDNLSNPDVKLVDGRPFDQYTGESPGKVFHTGTEHQRGGHIYGAKTVPWADNLNEDGTFKSPNELIEIYANHEIYNEGVVVTYCNEGLHAAMPWFVLHELLGYEDVRLYDSSMVEWANIFDTPMKTGEHCM